MKHKLNPRLSSSDWKEFCGRFHFPADEMPNIRAIYTALFPLIEPMRIILWIRIWMKSTWRIMPMGL